MTRQPSPRARKAARNDPSERLISFDLCMGVRTRHVPALGLTQESVRREVAVYAPFETFASVARCKIKEGIRRRSAWGSAIANG